MACFASYRWPRRSCLKALSRFVGTRIVVDAAVVAKVEHFVLSSANSADLKTNRASRSKQHTNLVAGLGNRADTATPRVDGHPR
jgi:hypothetical protein